MMRVTIIVNLFLLLTCFLILSGGEEDTSNVVVRLEKVLCTCGNYCTFTTCKVKFKSRSVAEMNVIGTSTRKISSLKITVKTFYKFSNNEYRPLFVNTKYDFCDAQAGNSNSKVFSAIMSALGNDTNFNQKCPLMPGQYYVKDFNFHARHLPSIIPVGRYLINSTARVQNNDWLYNTSVYFSITYHGVKDFSMG